MSSSRWGLSVLLVGALATSLAPSANADVEANGYGHGHGDAKRTVGYYTQWSGYGRNFLVNDLVKNGTAGKLTHLNYAFGFLDETGKCYSADPWADYQRPFTAEQSVDGVADVAGQALSGNLNQLKELKARFPQLRVNISLGGWTGSKYFSNAALTPASRAASVKSCLDLWIKGDLGGAPGAAAGLFDGIDLDWEWPSSEGNAGNVVRPEDKVNFTALVAEYRKQLDRLGRSTRKSYDLTAFLPADPVQLDRGVETRKVFRNLTFATLQGYDYHGAWEAVTNQQSSIRTPKGDPSASKFSSQVTVDAYLTRGAPRNKVVLGVPFYSRGWTGVTNADNGLFQTSTGPAPGTYEAGIEDYKTLKGQLAKFKVYRDPKAGHAWLFDGTTYWTWDDAVEIRRKARYVSDRDLGGAMVWSLDGDTADGELITALRSGLSG